jgi:alpha/beta superfamily hydrolase
MPTLQVEAPFMLNRACSIGHWQSEHTRGLNMAITVCFSHGKESGPWGRKITLLAEICRRRGFVVTSPDYRFTMDPDERVRHLLAQDLEHGDALILVGSSMGGYVAAVASQSLRPRGLFLMAPAVDLPGFAADTTPVAQYGWVVHGWRDDIVPPANAIAYAQRHHLQLHMLDAEHSLNDRLDQLTSLFELFLNQARAEAPRP